MNKNLAILSSLVLASVFGLLYFGAMRENTLLQARIQKLTPADRVVVEQSVPKDCQVRVEDTMVSGDSMTPLIKNGEKIKVMKNYYTCNGAMQRGDITIYESFTTGGPIIKQVRVLPGDLIRFESGKLLINGEVMKNSVGQEYVFSASEVRYMSMYIEGGKLQNGSFFAFGDNITNSVDSRKMGGLGIHNFQGKVIR